MFGSYSDFGTTFAAMNQLRRQVERAFAEADAPAPRADGPRVSVYDGGAALVLMADVPGLAEKDLTITLHDDVLSVSGVRPVTTPQGYTVHRQERRTLRFQRTFALPVKVKAEEVSAAIKDGVLTITLPKAPEAQPRQIAVQVA
jgi:HSP20 family protein